MPKISFSHHYNKMPGCILSGNCKQAKLIEVFLITKERLSDTFIEYDTTTISGDRYKLSTGKLIVLLLMSDNELWTTVRSYNQQKEEYYKKLRGTLFDIVISGE